MTAVIWMAVPPEVHSALLSTGAGPGSTLAAAAQWHELGSQYSATAAELSRLLAEVGASSWQGAGATEYVAAHGPYLSWLEQASRDCEIAATQHETAAAAYDSARAAMPSLVELAANHTTHTVLMSTNFFGINTIPIALNEADYARMWVQAADIMTEYQTITASATSAVPTLQPAPPILKQGALARSAPTADSDSIARFISQIITFVSQLGTPQQIDQILEFFQQLFQQLGFSPGVAFVLAFVALWLYDVLWYPYYASYSLLLLPFFAPTLSALGALNALTLLPNGTASSGTLPIAVEPSPGQPIGSQITAAMMPAAPAAAGISPLPSASTPATPAAPPAAAAPASPGVSYAVPGLEPPGTRFGPTAGTKSRDTAADTIEATEAAGAGAVAAGVRRKRRRRRGARTRGYRDEFVEPTATMDGVACSVTESESTANEQGSGHLGFTGTAPIPAVARTAGMIEASSVGATASLPLLPASWEFTADATSEANRGNF